MNESLVQTDSNVDAAKLFFREPIEVVPNKLIVTPPTLKEVIRDYGEMKYFGVVHTICGIPSDNKYALHLAGIDYAAMSDYDYFLMMTRGLADSDLSIIIKGMNFGKMQPLKNPENGEPVLYDPETDLLFDRVIYQKLVTVLRIVHQIKPKPEKPMNKYTRQALIMEDKFRYERRKKNPNQQSILLPYIITLLCTEEFKYDSHSVLDIGVYELLTTYMQITHKKASCALNQGRFSGMIDTSKIDKRNFDWTYRPEQNK